VCCPSVRPGSADPGGRCGAKRCGSQVLLDMTWPVISKLVFLSDAETSAHGQPRPRGGYTLSEPVQEVGQAFEPNLLCQARKPDLLLETVPKGEAQTSAVPTTTLA